MQFRTTDNDLNGLDLLRFLLSITILIYHFPHFIFPFSDLQTLNKGTLPLSASLLFIYEYGDIAVRVFWMISGVIFFHFYMEKIATRSVSFKKFAFNRLSRLYPLHLLTLISVALLQYAYFQKFNVAFINPGNDFIHFILNLLMINYWSSKFGLSFNGPFWSVSVEIFVYIIFFLLAYVKLIIKPKFTLTFTLIFFVIYFLGILNPFNECLLFFFVGCMLAQNYQRVKFSHTSFLLLLITVLLTITYYTSIFSHEYVSRLINCVIRLGIGILLIIFFSKSFTMAGVTLRTFLRTFGNMTYAMYMIHYSLQIILILIFYQKGIEFINTSEFMISYILITAILGYLIYRFFESPSQNFLRRLARDL